MTALLDGIRASAKALGMPVDTLATIISYETGGTFNPLIRGKTTKWGQHRGLIQFGEPQAIKYGVDWDNPIGSQLGSDGAIVKYFRDHGWVSGMSTLDAYSVVNAGAPGRYNASDAAAGGAQGTVFEKVTTQFAPHLEKARRLLGISSPTVGAVVDGVMVGKDVVDGVQPGGWVSDLSSVMVRLTVGVLGLALVAVAVIKWRD